MTENSLDIVFMGNPDFAVPSFQCLHNSIHRIVAVVTGTDKRRGRGGKTTPSPVKKAAIKANVPVLETDEVSSERFCEQVKALQPDLLVVVAFRILPPPVLKTPKIGSLNLHASLLPKYRGAAPIHHALINGESETGCTVFLLDEGMDTGLILNQASVKIDTLDTMGDLHDRLKDIGADLVLKTVNEISCRKHTPKEQDDQFSSRAPKITAKDARIDFTKNCMNVHNLIRGMSPVPGAWTEYAGNKLKVLRTVPLPDRNLAPGHAELDKGIAIAGCGTGCIVLEQVQPENRKIMSGPEFINGEGGTVQLAV